MALEPLPGTGWSFDQCGYACLQSPGCRAFSFRDSDSREARRCTLRTERGGIEAGVPDAQGGTLLLGGCGCRGQGPPGVQGLGRHRGRSG